MVKKIYVESDVKVWQDKYDEYAFLLDKLEAEHKDDIQSRILLEQQMQYYNDKIKDVEWNMDRLRTAILVALFLIPVSILLSSILNMGLNWVSAILYKNFDIGFFNKSNIFNMITNVLISTGISFYFVIIPFGGKGDTRGSYKKIKNEK